MRVEISYDIESPRPWTFVMDEKSYRFCLIRNARSFIRYHGHEPVVVYPRNAPMITLPLTLCPTE